MSYSSTSIKEASYHKEVEVAIPWRPFLLNNKTMYDDDLRLVANTKRSRKLFNLMKSIDLGDHVIPVGFETKGYATTYM